MYVKALNIQRFRGFRDLTIKPKGHVVVMGPPACGRSDLLEALIRVLDPEASRLRTTTEIDFFQKATAQPIQIEVTLAELGVDLEQRFLDELELWDRTGDQLVSEVDTPDVIDQGGYEWVLRIEHRATWVDAEQLAEESLVYPKFSEGVSSPVTVRRADLRELGFATLRFTGGKILDLGSRASFRAVVDGAPGGDFATATMGYVRDVEAAAANMTLTGQVQEALATVLSPISDIVGVQLAKPLESVQFGPEGGSLNGLLRALSPSLDMGDGSGRLPLWRHGSTTTNAVRIAEGLARSAPKRQILALDDLGDGLHGSTAAHLAAQMKAAAGQVWISTRLPTVAEVFEPREVIRLGRDPSGDRLARAGRQPATKAEGVAAKHWHRSLLPALSYRSVVVVEGPNDFTVLQSLSLRLLAELGQPLLATRGMAVINAGSAGAGGYTVVPKLAAAARDLGLRAIGVVDGDMKPETLATINAWLPKVDALVRLPDKVEIEAALVTGVAEPTLRQALDDLVQVSGITKPLNADAAQGVALEKLMISFIKANSLHGPFIDVLDVGNLPPLATRLLQTLASLATNADTGLIQL